MHSEFTHFDKNGSAVMVDVSEKSVTHRTAAARGSIHVNDTVMDAILKGTAEKGDVLGVARIAGIMGAKETSRLIPMCHPLMLTKCSIDFQIEKETNTIHVFCTVKTDGKTGVEMEALTGVNITLLTIYDMCKAMDKFMIMDNICLVEKIGGKSGHLKNPNL